MVHLLFEKMYFINIIRSINETKVKFKIANFELKRYFVHIHCIKYKYLCILQNQGKMLLTFRRVFLKIITVLLLTLALP